VRRVDRRQCSSSKSSSLLGRCVLPVFRRRARNTDTDIVTLDTRWAEAPLPPLPNSTAAIVESMSADFTSEHRHRRTGATDRHSRTRTTTTTTSGSAVRKSRSLHGSSVVMTQVVTQVMTQSHDSSVVAMSCLTPDLDVISNDDVTSLQLLNQQPRLLTQSCHNDDDDDENEKLPTSVNGHHSVQNGDRQHGVSVLCQSVIMLLCD